MSCPCCDPPCCGNIQLQAVLTISGVQDGTGTGCDCMNGVYVVDVVDRNVDPGYGIDAPGNGYFTLVLYNNDCVAQDENENPYSLVITFFGFCSGVFITVNARFDSFPFFSVDILAYLVGVPACSAGSDGFSWQGGSGLCDNTAATVTLAFQVA